MPFVKGYTPTKEHRNKISISNKGRNVWNKGLRVIAICKQ